MMMMMLKLRILGDYVRSMLHLNLSIQWYVSILFGLEIFYISLFSVLLTKYGFDVQFNTE